MLLLRTLFAVLVVKTSAARGRVIDIKIELPPAELDETIHSCIINALESDPTVFSADQNLIESNEEDFDWASQGWSKVSRVCGRRVS